jgi:hypothetical protein
MDELVSHTRGDDIPVWKNSDMTIARRIGITGERPTSALHMKISGCFLQLLP